MCYYRMKIRVKESQAHARRTGTFHSIVTIGVPWLFLKYDSINTRNKQNETLPPIVSPSRSPPGGPGHVLL